MPVCGPCRSRSAVRAHATTRVLRPADRIHELGRDPSLRPIGWVAHVAPGPVVRLAVGADDLELGPIEEPLQPRPGRPRIGAQIDALGPGADDPDTLGPLGRLRY